MPAEKMARVEEYVCGRVGESGVGRVGGGGNSSLKTIQLKIKKSALGNVVGSVCLSVKLAGLSQKDFGGFLNP
jgi:hypothetical protein